MANILNNTQLDVDQPDGGIELLLFAGNANCEFTSSDHYGKGMINPHFGLMWQDSQLLNLHPSTEEINL